MNLLVTVADYPHEDKVTLMYVHTRNLEYKKQGINVTVLNFKTTKEYTYDGIEVISLKTFYEKKKRYDILVCHAPNIRNHYIFLKRNHKKFAKIVFFFHGHEVLYCNKVYSKPYAFVKKLYLKTFIRNYYDRFKLYLWRKYLPTLSFKSHFIFVSNWMLEQFKMWVKLDEKQLNNSVSITYNSVGKEFEIGVYKKNKKKEYDFVTVRNNIDGSKYGIDIVCKLAKAYPEYRFLVVGKGEYFNYNHRPLNLEWKNQTMSHLEIIDILDKCNCALMPTRTDSQGLMMCEMNAYGIPLITSDISVCHEVFDGFKNVAFILNDKPEEDFPNKYKCLLERYSTEKNSKYFMKNTIKAEVAIFKKILCEGKE